MGKPNNTHQVRKDKRMYERYTKLSDQKVLGVKKLAHGAIMAMLEDEFFLDHKTIMQRIKRFASNKDKDPAQLTIELPI